jgi:hypothetical protein
MQQRGMHSAFVVGLDDLKRLDEIMASAGPRHYSVALSDGRELTARSLEDLTRITGFKARHIRRLEIAAEWSEILRATLTLQRERKLPSLSYDLIGEERSVANVARALDEWMSSVRAWYSRLATMDWVVLLLCTWLTVVLAIALVVLFLSRIGRLTFTGNPGFGDSLAFAMWTLPVLLGTIVNFLRNGLFPIGTYLIVDGAKRYERAIRARKVLGGGFLLSILAAFLTTVAASLL